MKKDKIRYWLKPAFWEAWIWIAALIALAFTNPTGESHFSLCPIKNLGWDFCPGCGLGHSIMWLFRANFSASFKAHPLGIPAVIILIYRIINIFTTQRKLKQSKINNHARNLKAHAGN
ncbi:DUF2752 domain-containing protein [Geofilum sp. OHC36d9]|uniref:DUF2752 domain-containing protein n=1 Tax=Geofilum sp. OHC36d9 TaxID=3458413 RepID=UPI004033AFBB